MLSAPLSLLCIGLALGAVTQPELECLRRMYEEMGGPGWWRTDNWPAPGQWSGDLDPCARNAPWYGISCNYLQEIVGIALSGNNLVGSVPQCVWAFRLSDFELSTTHLTGPMPVLNGADLQTLYYKYNDITTLPANICEMERLDSLHTEYNDMSGSAFPECFYTRLSSYTAVDCVDCNLSFQPGPGASAWKDLGATSVYLGGNRLGLQLNLTELQDAPRTTSLDISATGTTGRISLTELLRKFPKGKELSLQENALEGEVFGLSGVFPTIYVLDLAENEFAQVMADGDVSAFVDSLPTMVAFRASANRFGGFSPSTAELDTVHAAHPMLRSFNMSGNPFFCRPDGDNAFGCTYLRVLDSSSEERREGVMEVSLTLESAADLKAAPVELMAGRFSAAIRVFAPNGTRTTESVLVHDLALQRSPSGSGNTYTVSFSVKKPQVFSGEEVELQPRDFAVLFDGVAVSTGDLRVLAEDSAAARRSPAQLRAARASLAAAAPAAALRSSPAARPGSPGAPASAPAPAAPAPRAAPERLLVEFYGISKCPDYIDAVKELASPLINAYPEFMASIDLRFVTEGHPAPRYLTGGMILHGQCEVMGDKVLMCAQDLLDAAHFDRLTSCLYADGTANSIPAELGSCVARVAPGPMGERIMQCAESDHAIRLLAAASEARRERGAAWSCTIYADKKLTCSYGDGYCPFKSGDVEGFHTYLCGEYEAKFGRRAPGC